MVEKVHSVLSNAQVGQSVVIKAWLRTKRVSKNCAFLSVNDGSSHDCLQLVVDAQDAESMAKVAQLSTGASLEAQGQVIESPAKGQKFEIAVKALKVLGRAGEDYPLQKKGHTPEFLREIGHLRPRTNTFNAVFRVRSVLAIAVHDFFVSGVFPGFTRRLLLQVMLKGRVSYLRFL